MTKKSLVNSKILITGGTGFFGRSILRYFLEKYEKREEVPQIYILSRDPERFLLQYSEFDKYEWIKFYKGDILKKKTLPKKLKITHILHAATDSTIGPKMLPIDRYNQIVDGTKNILEYAVENKVKRLLFTSSGGVYGPQPEEMMNIREDYNGSPDPLKIHNTYSIAKRCAEHLCILYKEKYNLEIVIGRCFSFIGKDLPRNVHFAIGNFINDSQNKPVITINGDGDTVRSYLDQQDLAHWLIEMLIKGKNGTIYNVGSNERIKLRELAEIIRDELSPGKEIIIKGEKKLNDERKYYVPNVDKAMKELSLKVEIPLISAIRKFKIS